MGATAVKTTSPLIKPIVAAQPDPHPRPLASSRSLRGEQCTSDKSSKKHTSVSHVSGYFEGRGEGRHWVSAQAARKAGKIAGGMVPPANATDKGAAAEIADGMAATKATARGTPQAAAQLPKGPVKRKLEQGAERERRAKLRVRASSDSEEDAAGNTQIEQRKPAPKRTIAQINALGPEITSQYSNAGDWKVYTDSLPSKASKGFKVYVSPSGDRLATMRGAREAGFEGEPGADPEGLEEVDRSQRVRMSCKQFKQTGQGVQRLTLRR